MKTTTSQNHCEKHNWQNAFPGNNTCPYCPAPTDEPRCIRCHRILPSDAIYAHGRCDDCEYEGRAEEAYIERHEPTEQEAT